MAMSPVGDDPLTRWCHDSPRAIDADFSRDPWTSGRKGAKMTGAEFIRRARRHARRSGLGIRFLPNRGKGSHRVLYVGAHRTVVKTGEIGPGLLRSMLRQLRIPKEDF